MFETVSRVYSPALEGEARRMKFKAELEVDGTGNWAIVLPINCDRHDVLALGPVIEGITAFLAPGIDTPIDLLPDDGCPDLIA